MIRRILTLRWNPYQGRILRSKCSEVAWQDDWPKIVRDLKDTIEANPNAMGLAAPQIGSLLRIFVVRDGPRFLTFINPSITDDGELESEHESCLSMPGCVALVTRPKAIKVVPVRLKNAPKPTEPTEFKAPGRIARVIQHEFDHLSGILITDREAQAIREKKAGS
jgi:peptide deformylase